MSLVIEEDQKGDKEEPPLLSFYSTDRTRDISNEGNVVSKEYTRDTKVDCHTSKETAEVSKEIAVSPRVLTIVFQTPGEAYTDTRPKGASKEAALVSREATQVSKEAALVSKGAFLVSNEVDLVPKDPSQVSKEAALISKEAAVVSAPVAKVASQVSLEAEMVSKELTPNITKLSIISKMITKDPRKLKKKKIPVPNDTSGMETTE